MSTLAEIEAALPRLSRDELHELAQKLNAELAREGSLPEKVCTGFDAARWWEQREDMSDEDAGAFARDWEEARSWGRGEPIPPPTAREVSRWVREREYMTEEEAEAFARDVEAGRRLANRPSQPARCDD